jgi:hypothetical protein
MAPLVTEITTINLPGVSNFPKLLVLVSFIFLT